jgi:DNA-binding IclR family transcriptional regulator
MPEHEKKRILARKRLFFYGDSAHLDMKKLKTELEECRLKGFSQDIGKLQPGINAVSSPIFGPNQRIIGCVILMGTFPEELIEIKGEKVVETAKQISWTLGSGNG